MRREIEYCGMPNCRQRYGVWCLGAIVHVESRDRITAVEDVGVSLRHRFCRGRLDWAALARSSRRPRSHEQKDVLATALIRTLRLPRHSRRARREHLSI